MSLDLTKAHFRVDGMETKGGTPDGARIYVSVTCAPDGAAATIAEWDQALSALVSGPQKWTVLHGELAKVREELAKEAEWRRGAENALAAAGSAVTYAGIDGRATHTLAERVEMLRKERDEYRSKSATIALSPDIVYLEKRAQEAISFRLRADQAARRIIELADSLRIKG